MLGISFSSKLISWWYEKLYEINTGLYKETLKVWWSSLIVWRMRWKESFDLICGWNRFLIIIKDMICCHQYFLGAFLEKAKAPKKVWSDPIKTILSFSFFPVICIKQNSEKILKCPCKVSASLCPCDLTSHGQAESHLPD